MPLQLKGSECEANIQQNTRDRENYVNTRTKLINSKWQKYTHIFLFIPFSLFEIVMRSESAYWWTRCLSTSWALPLPSLSSSLSPSLLSLHTFCDNSTRIMVPCVYACLYVFFFSLDVSYYHYVDLTARIFLGCTQISYEKTAKMS